MYWICIWFLVASNEIIYCRKDLEHHSAYTSCTASLSDGAFLYACLQTGRIMVWWCPSGSPSVHPTLRPSVWLSVRVSVRPFSALFSYMLWHIELKFCTWLCFDVLQIKIDCRLRQFLMELCLFVNLEYRQCAVFCTFLPHALTYWAEILHMTLFHRTTEQVRV